MDLKTSVIMVQYYAQTNGLSVLDALNQLDLLLYEDWVNTSPGAPKCYVRNLKPIYEDVLQGFTRNRQGWIAQAQALNVDLTGFTL